MRNVTDFLGEVANEFPDELAGKGGFGGFDGPPLDLTRQYRVEVDKAEWRQAQSGKWSYSITFEVIEDLKDEFVGRKFSEYYNIDKGASEAAKRGFAKFLGESGVDLSSIKDTDNDAFIQHFVGVRYVIAPRHWGDEDDRTGIRYLNRDRGQELQDNIKPPKPRGGTADLSAEIRVNKDSGPFPAASEEQGETAEQSDQVTEPAPQAAPLPGTGTKTGVNLPPGLAR